MNDGFTHYVSSMGLPELRKRSPTNCVSIMASTTTPNEILVTPSAKFAIYLALTSFLDHGDEVLILDPSWVSYKALVQLAGATPVNVPLSYDNNYTLTAADLAKYVTAKTRMIILNTPNTRQDGCLLLPKTRCWSNLSSSTTFWRFLMKSTKRSFLTITSMWPWPASRDQEQRHYGQRILKKPCHDGLANRLLGGRQKVSSRNAESTNAGDYLHRIVCSGRRNYRV